MPMTLKPWQALALSVIFVLAAAFVMPGCATGERDAFWDYHQRIGH